MPNVTYVQCDGSAETAAVEIGTSVMLGAVMNGVAGIVAECGGAASCATCHVYVDEVWVSRLAEPDEDETAMLDCTASERRPSSRLSCQLKMTSDLDGLVVHVPESQS